nr:hypothetical protein [Tanacetum cinerariifolium]
MSAGFHANTSRWRLNNPYSSFHPSSVRVDPIATVCSGCSGWIATWIFSFLTWLMADRGTPSSETLEHSSEMILLLCNVTIPPATRNFIILCAVDGIARIFLTLSLPIILLQGEGDLTTMKFIRADIECSSSPTLTSNDICPRGHIISLLNPTKGVVIGEGGLNFPLSKARISLSVIVRMDRNDFFRSLLEADISPQGMLQLRSSFHPFT